MKEHLGFTLRTKVAVMGEVQRMMEDVADLGWTNFDEAHEFRKSCSHLH